MDPVHEWSVRLASAVAPDEVELAPALAAAYVKGGRERRDLFATGGGTVGGFMSGEFVVLLPYALKAIAAGGPLLRDLLAWDNLGECTNIVKNVILLLLAGKSVREALAGGDRSPAHAVALARLQRVSAVLSQELADAKLSRDQCDAITYRVLDVLLEDPKGARSFIGTLTERT
jgi:hypothetical protein